MMWCIGASLQASSTGSGMLMAGRILSGPCIGPNSALAPVYQSEIAPRKIRGRIVSFQHFAIALGILVQFLIEYGYRWDKVLHVLAFLRTPNCNINDPLVLAEYKEIEDQVRIEREKDSSSHDELFGKKMPKRLLLGMAVQALSQLTGVIVILYLILNIFKSAGIFNTLLATAILYILFAVTSR
ncbi:hypothetical protein V1517DRAFT_337520 [Lipomyces orientalis]|uniref:Uncharacterized protein n=1 Tax=Lipomyces orientalis TaxID=1233043 RepID=A0ACC3TRF5_9ASCO